MGNREAGFWRRVAAVGGWLLVPPPMSGCGLPSSEMFVPEALLEEERARGGVRDERVVRKGMG